MLLEACNTGRDQRGQPVAELVCSCSGGRQLWADRVQGCVVQLTGTLNFSAVSTSTGDLLVR